MARTRASVRLATRKAVDHENKTQQPHKKQAGNLEKFIHIPMDIFTEIASHLFPIDIISLSHSSKFFRNLLMRRSSRHIWVGAMRNVQGGCRLVHLT
ncbi:hypothetical protein RSAG8_06347, partial [Rhizoctonia solani AG-8 WAC10335]